MFGGQSVRELCENQEQNLFPPSQISSSLLDTVLSAFDRLASEGLLHFDNPVAKSIYTTSGFCIELRLNPSFRKKPALAASAALSPANPFLNPDPRMVVIDQLGPRQPNRCVNNVESSGTRNGAVSELSMDSSRCNESVPSDTKQRRESNGQTSSGSAAGAKYRLMMNKFCVYKPQLLITTREFASQAADLDADDLETCWAVMATLTDAEVEKSVGVRQHTGGVQGDVSLDARRYMMIYNAGRSSGNSQPHKHMQVFPEPSRSEHVFYFDPSNPAVRKVGDRESVQLWSAINVPFWYVSARLPSSLKKYRHSQAENSNQARNMAPPAGKTSSARDVLWHMYFQLLAEMKEELVRVGVPGPASYNVILTQDMMVLIPRRMPGREGLMLNAAGMAGLVWLSWELDLKQWTPPRLEAHLENCGLPRRAQGPWSE